MSNASKTKQIQSYLASAKSKTISKEQLQIWAKKEGRSK